LDERRSEPRYPFALPAEISASGAVEEVMLRDISSTGLSFFSPREIPLRKRIRCTVKLPGGMQIAYTPTPVRVEQFGKHYGIGASLLGSMATGFTGRESREEQISGNDARFRALIEYSTDCITLTDVRGNLLYASNSSNALIGYEPDELLHRSIFDLVHRDDLAASRAVFTACMRSAGQSFTMEIRLQHKDESYRWVQCLLQNRMHDPAVKALVLNHRDISDRKHLEGERDRLIAELSEAAHSAKVLTGLLPICASCKKIRDEQGEWGAVEVYIRERSEAKFTHGICPDCKDKLYPELNTAEKA
jgi:PAS domain S-box-containing protein